MKPNIKLNLSKRRTYFFASLLVFIVGTILQVWLQINSFIILTLFGFPFVAALTFLYLKLNDTFFSIDKAILLFILLTCIFLLPFNFPNISAQIKLLYFAVMSLHLYILLLAINIYSVSEKFTEDLPLLQPARLILYVTGVILVYLYSIVVYKIGLFPSYPIINLIIKSILFIAFYYVLLRSLHWFFVEEKIGEVREKKLLRYSSISRFSTLVLSQGTIILMFFPYEAYAASVITATLMYINLSIIQNYLGHKLNRKILIEYFVILCVVFFVAYFIS